MPIHLEEMQKKTSELALLVGENTLNVKYRPWAVTMQARQALLAGPAHYMRIESDLKDEAKADAAWQSYCTQLAAILVDWDVLDDKGKTIAPTAKFIEGLAVGFVFVLAREVVKDSLRDTSVKADAPTKAM